VNDGDGRPAIREHALELALDVAVIDPGLAVDPGVDPELRRHDALDPVGPRRGPRKISLKPQPVRAMIDARHHCISVAACPREALLVLKAPLDYLDTNPEEAIEKLAPNGICLGERPHQSHHVMPLFDQRVDDVTPETATRADQQYPSWYFKMRHSGPSNQLHG
jgi:hypothetical protein